MIHVSALNHDAIHDVNLTMGFQFENPLSHSELLIFQMNHFPILYSFRRCPYAMRARMAIRMSARSVVLREVSLRDKPQALRDISPKATVPVLHCPDGRVIEQSLEIMCWALGTAWLDEDAQSLIDVNDGEFKKALDCYKYAERFPEFSRETYRSRGETYLQVLERCLELTSFLAGQQSALDWAIFPFIRQFAAVDAAWFENSDYPKLKAWLTMLQTSDVFVDIMRPQPIWYESVDESIW